MGEEHADEHEMQDIIPVSGMYENWFLDYASYVILERAVPAMEDGLKPVQRRILHAMKEMDDGRYNKVANIIGSTMQYHPHGDASIADAIVNLGQKDLLIDAQGNWGDVRTGDSAAASRYIEARLSKFALEVVFNPQTTKWQLSYDGRKREPVTFPVKFPLLLTQGVEGIAVGLSTKVLPHNFHEILHAAIGILKGKKVQLYPDFLTGGKIDVSDYNEELDSKHLIIKDIPFGTTTTSLIDSVIKANDKGKIKIKHVVDNTAADVEIQVTLAPGMSPDITMDALYAFTDCEVSISPNACIIKDEKPQFLGITDILNDSVHQTVDLLKQELEIRRNELMEKILFSSLEKIFIENRIYRDIEECETWEDVISTIDQGLEPFKSQFYRDIASEDIVRLTEIKIKRISRFDAFKADDLMRKLQEELEQVAHHLAHLTEYAVAYYEGLLKKYGEGRERKTEITNFDNIQATFVAANNAKLYMNASDGFVGYGLKKDQFVSDCSDIDDIIVFRRDGKCVVTRIQDKVFVGKDILHAGVFKKGDERMVYNLMYIDGKTGRTMVKRFFVTSVTRDKEYDLTKGAKGSKIQHFSANPNGEAETVTVHLTGGSKARVKVFDFDFATIEIKGRSAGGNIVTKHPVRKILFKSAGVSTLGGLDMWYDSVVGRLNKDRRGHYLGNFQAEDQIVVFHKDGSYEITSFEITNRYEVSQVLLLTKYLDQQPVTAVYLDGDNKINYIKRFLIETSKANKRYPFISEHKSSKLLFAGYGDQIAAEVIFKDGRKKETTEVELTQLIDVKGWKATGNKFVHQNVQEIRVKQVEEPVKETIAPVAEDADVTEEVINELKSKVVDEVEKEDTQLGLFGTKSEE
jgi:topoisomerase-4 subunit A